MKSVNKAKRWFIETVDKIYKPLTILIKKKERTHKLPVLGVKEGPY